MNKSKWKFKLLTLLFNIIHIEILIMTMLPGSQDEFCIPIILLRTTFPLVQLVARRVKPLLSPGILIIIQSK